jgi:hypothetical protein
LYASLEKIGVNTHMLARPHANTDLGLRVEITKTDKLSALGLNAHEVSRGARFRAMLDLASINPGVTGSKSSLRRLF